MKVKYMVAIALSHNARLLIFDEPTSGLDPVAGMTFDALPELVKDGERSILYSTHITSDLDKCADDITTSRTASSAECGKGVYPPFQHLKEPGGRGTHLEEIMIRTERRAYNV